MDGRYYEAVLSSKGLAVLRLIPDVLSNPAPLGEQIRSAVRAGATSAAKTLLDKALDAGFRYALTRAGVSG
jgi:hypothetical protein